MVGDIQMAGGRGPCPLVIVRTDVVVTKRRHSLVRFCGSLLRSGWWYDEDRDMSELE